MPYTYGLMNSIEAVRSPLMSAEMRNRYPSAELLASIPLDRLQSHARRALEPFAGDPLIPFSVLTGRHGLVTGDPPSMTDTAWRTPDMFAYLPYRDEPIWYAALDGRTVGQVRGYQRAGTWEPDHSRHAGDYARRMIAGLVRVTPGDGGWCMNVWSLGQDRNGLTRGADALVTPGTAVFVDGIPGLIVGMPMALR